MPDHKLGPRDRAVLEFARRELSPTEPREFNLKQIAVALGASVARLRPVLPRASRARRRLVELGYLRRNDDGYLLAG